ncbi:MAG: stalk domain-containing protein [Candidatus Cryosericum sp.]
MNPSPRFFLTLFVCVIMSFAGVTAGGFGARVVVAADQSIGVYSGDVSSMGWIERQPAGDVGLEWYALASDSSGSKLVAAAFGVYGAEGWVYTSTNGGVSWTVRSPIAASQYWRAAASDSDGSNLVVAAWAGRIYTSSNGGASWTERQPAGAMDQRWQTVASDADGSNLIAGTSAGRLWISSDGGKTWSETRPAGDVPGDWRGASSSSDGRVLVVGNYNGRLYLTTNGGAGWAELTPAGTADKNWQGTACDQNGTNLIVGVEGGRLYTSSNGGSSWIERRPVGDTNQNWSRFASDSDGSVLLAANEARLYRSTDSGATWTEQRPAGDKDVRWTCCSNADGSNLAVAAYGGGRLYTFAVNPLVCTLAVTKVGGGTVTLDPSGGTYNRGTVVTLTAAPDSGYAFAGWSGDFTSAGNPVSITMNSDKAVTATFVALATYGLTPSAGTGGGITPGTVQTVLRGASKTFTISPDAGYQIADVSVDGVSQGRISSYTFTNVTSSHTISARFEKEKQQAVIVLQIGKSTFTVNGASKTLDSPPVIANGRTLVPIRAIIEALGGAVEWDGVARKATVTLGNVTIELWIGKSVARVNNISTRIDSTNLKVVPEIINGRTMLPLRFVSENVGCVVEWTAATQTITITYAP